MITIDGRQLAQDKLDELGAQVARAGGRVPGLAVVLVGDDEPSHLYVKLKQKAAKKAGIDFHKYLLSADSSQKEVLGCIQFLRKDEDVDGVIVQLPLPAQIDTDVCIAAIGAAKDADGFHPENIAQFVGGQKTAIFPVFPKALVLLALASVGEFGVDADLIIDGEKSSLLAGKKAVVIANSKLFAQVMSEACRRIGLVVAVVMRDQLKCCQAQVLSADVIFTACGEVGLVDESFVKSGAIVIDGGISKVGDKVVGDVDVASVSDKVAALTPVPGGVGPMTIACLLAQVVRFAQSK